MIVVAGSLAFDYIMNFPGKFKDQIMPDTLISNPLGILFVLTGVVAFFIFLQRATKWKFFDYFPPLLFIYAVPLVLSNTFIISNESPMYNWMGSIVPPMFIVCGSK